MHRLHAIRAFLVALMVAFEIILVSMATAVDEFLATSGTGVIEPTAEGGAADADFRDEVADGWSNES